MIRLIKLTMDIENKLAMLYEEIEILESKLREQSAIIRDQEAQITKLINEINDKNDKKISTADTTTHDTGS